ncbi:DnaJ domain protein [Aspergillus fijiensis CBS 313.89]|uniref:J domain-containing protein n=1 Tax=Aspergillus fijiensis CBS 313.89 TaxID=1448319 RepID=A0A8G1RH03_9EURO|nr:uncharacterized protein BO72DRAFT_532577 [Aspergillus fijiensis CBS 313.89]RAK71620.1 hypothetical protein BO72DRAFT_532577 [Aspergillus fijiensis CBS 313.89]
MTTPTFSSSTFIDCYATLNIKPHADLKEINSAYKRLALRYHPDKTEGGDAETFQKILYAVETLRDPNHRAIHDAALDEHRCRNLKYTADAGAFFRRGYHRHHHHQQQQYRADDPYNQSRYEASYRHSVHMDPTAPESIEIMEQMRRDREYSEQLERERERETREAEAAAAAAAAAGLFQEEQDGECEGYDPGRVVDDELSSWSSSSEEPMGYYDESGCVVTRKKDKKKKQARRRGNAGEGVKGVEEEVNEEEEEEETWIGYSDKTAYWSEEKQAKDQAQEERRARWMASLLDPDAGWKSMKYSWGRQQEENKEESEKDFEEECDEEYEGEEGEYEEGEEEEEEEEEQSDEEDSADLLSEGKSDGQEKSTSMGNLIDLEDDANGHTEMPTVASKGSTKSATELVPEDHHKSADLLVFVDDKNSQASKADNDLGECEDKVDLDGQPGRAQGHKDAGWKENEECYGTPGAEVFHEMFCKEDIGPKRKEVCMCGRVEGIADDEEDWFRYPGQMPWGMSLPNKFSKRSTTDNDDNYDDEDTDEEEDNSEGDAIGGHEGEDLEDDSTVHNYNHSPYINHNDHDHDHDHDHTQPTPKTSNTANGYINIPSEISFHSETYHFYDTKAEHPAAAQQSDSDFVTANEDPAMSTDSLTRPANIIAAPPHGLSAYLTPLLPYFESKLNRSDGRYTPDDMVVECRGIILETFCGWMEGVRRTFRDAATRGCNDEGECLHLGYWDKAYGQAECKVCGQWEPIFTLTCPGCGLEACVACKFTAPATWSRGQVSGSLE